jgi:glycerol dehydratase small subunit/propanediol dehydratase small subunit
MSDITLKAVLDGEVTMEDIAITPEALRAQADIARSAGRPTLADNFERAAELTAVPQDEIMAVYELLRPGRSRSPDPLLEAAERFETVHGAVRMATFLREAAAVYARRGLFSFRF